MTSLFNLFQSINKLIEIQTSDPKLRETLTGSPESYNLDISSLFLDIGSGFGKPVFHAALQVGCESKGIEVVPARVEFCLDFYYEFLNDKCFFEEVEKKANDETLNVSTSKSEKVPACSTATTTISSTSDQNVSSSNTNNLCSGISVKNIVVRGIDEEMQFINNIKLNSLNSSYYDQVIRDDSSALYLELRISQDLIYEDCFTEYIIAKEVLNKSVLVSKQPVLQFGDYFVTDEINIEITPIDDHLYSNIVKVIINSLYIDALEQDVIVSIIGEERIRNIYEIVEKVENLAMLQIISFVNTIFNGRKSFSDGKFLLKSSEPGHPSDKGTPKRISICKKDLYEELKVSLENQEKLINEIYSRQNSGLDKGEMDNYALKAALVDLKCNYDSNWYNKTSFISQDATINKNFVNDKKEHFTHIYAYNKLMSKECRSKIAKILNKTKFKVLAWYSNPKQTKSAGLKYFTFLCKFPMQSTSTEKFHVYVYLKTK